MKPTDPKIVVLGGGTGSFVVLSALKKLTKHLTAIVNMVDDGGSTGTLRDELGVLPPGDVRQCLVALSRSPKLRDLFTYRLEEGSMRGHAFGNLFLATLENMTGSFKSALATASEVLNIIGDVQPATFTPVTLELKDGNTTIAGQNNIENYTLKQRHPQLSLSPTPTPNPAALTAIKHADLIVIAPGNLYCSLAPTLLVPQIGPALAAAKAPVVYIANLVNKPKHAKGFSVKMYVEELERCADTPFINTCLYNTAPLSPDLLASYAQDGELPVKIDIARHKFSNTRFLGLPLLAKEPHGVPSKSDPLARNRTLIRHSPTLLARSIFSLLPQ